MKYVKILSVIIFLACLLFLFILFQNYNKIQTQCHKLEQSIKSKTDSINDICRFIEENYLIENGIIDNHIVKNTTTNELIELSSLFNSSSNVNIIIRLIETSCGSCNKKQLEIFKYFKNEENITVLSYEKNARRLRLFTTSFNNEVPIFQLSKSQILYENDDALKVLVMYVTNNGEILKTFHFRPENLFLVKYLFKRRSTHFQ